MDVTAPGAFRWRMGWLLVGIGACIAIVESTAAWYASRTAVADRSMTGITLLTVPLVVALLLSGAFILVSSYEWRHHSKRVEAQDEPPHGPRPGF